MAFCHQCGVEIVENEDSCQVCGAVQAGSSVAPAEAAAAVAAASVEEKIVPSHSEAEIVQPVTDDEIEKPITNDIADPNEADPADLNDTTEAAVGETSSTMGGYTGGRKPGLKTLAEATLLAGRYQIVRKIGGGGMGAVYLATDRNLGGVERAVKEMVQSSIEEEQQNKAIEDFRRESTILSSLDHPAIPTIYDYFYDDFEGRFYLVMKYISGGDLARRLRAAPGGRVDEKLVTEWAVQVADVLSYLHSLPTTIVYRDLKPSNIMLDGSSGRVMLIDFGIARSINQASQEKGVTAVGTMGYAPPELFSGQVEPRSDIYSLGSTMFHLLTGADPQNNPLLIFDFQKNPRPRQINPQLSDQMERILMRAVEYNADARFSSADEMRQVLNDHLSHLTSGKVTFGVSAAPASVSLANQSVFCGFCGQRIVATDLFCAFCGSKQPIAQQGVHSEIYTSGGGTAKLLIEGTTELDAPVFALEKSENLVGRRDPQSNIFPEVDLSKYDPQTKISRRHARIWREGGNFLVEDLGSSNGTILMAGYSDMVRLTPRQPHVLGNGDRLRLGDTTLHFLMG
jgi:serine/threonine-protein kinase